MKNLEQNIDNADIYEGLGVAFLAGKTKSLYDLIVKQGDSLLQKCGAVTPSNCVSIVLFLERKKLMTSAEIANSLKKSHQLISQRLDRLEKLGLIKRIINEEDKRARCINLSESGVLDLPKVKQACLIADKSFQKIYKQLNFNLGNAIDHMEEKLKENPLERY